MAVLGCLAESAGDVVSRDDLFDAVWPGGTVTDDVLTHCIVELRKAFGDSAKDAQVIETIPKSGFRLMLPVRPVNDAAEPGTEAGPPGKKTGKPMWISAAVVALAIAGLWGVATSKIENTDVSRAGLPSIAIYPFADASPEGDQAWLADSLTEELTNRLSRLDGLIVIGAQSAFLLRDTNLNVEAVGDALNVNYIVSGSVQKQQDQLRVNAKMIDARTARVLWASSFDRPREDIFDVQTEISESVAGSLSITLGVGQLGTAEEMTRNVDAYEEAMRIFEYSSEHSADTWQRVEMHLIQATNLDPEFAWAWIHLADHYRVARMFFGRTYPWQENSEHALANAFKSAPSSPFPHLADARLRVDMGEWRKAQRSLLSAVELMDETLAEYNALQTDIRLKAGTSRNTITTIKEMIQRNPLLGEYYLYLGHVYAMQGRLVEANEAFEQGWLQPVNASAGVHDALIVALSGDDRNLQHKWLNRTIEFEAMTFDESFHAMMLELFGDREAALAWLRNRFQTSIEKDYWIATWAAHYGDIDLALDAIRRSPDGWSMWMPVMAEARKSEEFKLIVRDIGLIDFWNEFGWGEFCRPLDDEDFECS